MSVLQVANVWFESTGTQRIERIGSVINIPSTVATPNIWFDPAGTKYLANTTNGVTIGTYLHAVDFNSTSDVALKDNVMIIDSALEKIDHINGVRFNWKNDGRAAAGVLAHEVEEILPEIVSNINDYKSVNYSGIIALLVQAIKELKEELETLKKH